MRELIDPFNGQSLGFVTEPEGTAAPAGTPTRPAQPDASHKTLEGRSQGRAHRANRTEGLREQPARSPGLAEVDPFADRRPIPNPFRRSGQ